MANNELFFDRIIAGSLRGRKVALPKSADVRPSKNRVRQAVFNLLTARVEWQGLVVGDLFCGSGAWGLEALSRGAEKVFCVDLDERIAAQNIKELGAAGAKAVSADVRNWTPQTLLDVVMMDPPYGRELGQAVVNHAASIGKSGSWWCLECGREDSIDWTGFDEIDHRDYGASRVWIARQE